MATLTELLAQMKKDLPAKPQPVVVKTTVPLSAKLGLTSVAIPEEEIIGITSKAPVTETADLDRIMKLPRRQRPGNEELDKLVEKWNGILGNGIKFGQCNCETIFADRPVSCIHSLNRLQAWALEEYFLAGGLLGKLAVGAGKTGLDILLAMARPGVKVAVLLLQSTLIEQFVLSNWPQWAAHFNVPNLVVPRLDADGIEYDRTHRPGRPTLFVYSYTEFSLPKNTGLLSGLNPDLVIADESQNLANATSSRTKRFTNHFKERPDCGFVALSGSMNNRSIKDFAHHAAWALRKGSPLPLNKDVVKDWAAALDPAPKDGVRTPLGMLRVFCKTGDDAVEGVGLRILETLGVVWSEESSCDKPLLITTRRPPPIPPELREAMEATRANATRPDGEEAETAFQKAAWLKQLACGFYYYWKFIRNEPEELILKWFGRRKVYFKEVRVKLETNPGEHLDSPQLLKLAAKRHYEHIKSDLPGWPSLNYLPWVEVEHQVDPLQAVKWIDDHMLNDACAWAAERKAAGEGGIIWCEFTEIGERVAKKLGVPYYNGGPVAKAALLAATGKEIFVLSIKAHHRGTELQKFQRALVISNPADDGTWEQLLGRLHRFGQTKAVHFELYRHTPELCAALDHALERSAWIAKMDRTQRKLLLATKDWKKND